MKKMNKKYFVVSDIHGHYKELKKALDEAGGERYNKNHILIICGDIFDRGEENIEVYKFLKSLPKTRKKLIRGNHEYLLLDMIKNEVFTHTDFSNGTVNTLIDFTNNVHTEFSYFDYIFLNHKEELTKERIERFKKKAVYKWLLSDEGIDYFELDNYVFVHSFIPLHDKSDSNISVYYADTEYLEYFKDGRTETTRDEWYGATGGCPYKLFDAGLWPENKTLVCGHWHASDFHLHYDNIKNNHDMYIGDRLIALDACTILSKKVNVLVIDE